MLKEASALPKDTTSFSKAEIIPNLVYQMKHCFLWAHIRGRGHLWVVLCNLYIRDDWKLVNDVTV